MSARRIYIAVMGAWMGLAGIEHGVGEILQKNVVPQGVMILSWPESPFFRVYNGEPAMTILPDMRLTGILAVTFSLLYLVTAVFFSGRRPGGWVMMGLTVPMLLFGAGLFPPALGMLIGIAATRLQVRQAAQPDGALRHFAGCRWHWFLTALLVAWLMLLPGMGMLDYFFGIDHTGLVLLVMGSAFVFLYLTYWSAAQHDSILPTS